MADVDDTDDGLAGPDDGIGLCLSGGGYRAMLFHLGAIIRLNEIGLLPRLSRVSSVSGGSITAAYLGMRWAELEFDAEGRASNLSIVIDKIREMGRTSIDAGAIIGGLLLPGTISQRVAAAYDRVLFDGSTTDVFPADGAGPRFVINATNVQSAALWRFTKQYMGDYRVGLVKAPGVRLSLATTASSAFPPVLSPLVLPISADALWMKGEDLATPEFREKAVLSDGGVYDNLGLETVFKRYRTVLVSDAGQKSSPEVAPAHDWARHSLRILDVVDNQVRSLRKRGLIDAYLSGQRTGCYWSIRSRFHDYQPVSDPLGVGGWDTAPLAAVPTRLEAVRDDLQEGLINWGYAISDTALRRHYMNDLKDTLGLEIKDPVQFPYPHGF
ncbi:patatin-like phospholipase family protein [Neorhizobium sp. S3-V5DH]|uniref:patatin-like phospholipase family protein n=1 Tax=Neorhizobium sp. S3-V5DH TaxID=2485166 RepID=UPI00104451CE|nr:patatin-like phospholipase family protein [Neorhizobium sp. S3-V5DH]TCV57973.1 NTE family protein [Neorhizobium sp. S3-V5DH]